MNRAPFRLISLEEATPEGVADFGTLIGADEGLGLFAKWPGVSVYGPAPISIEAGAEILHAKMDAATFPARIAILERHFKHTQTFLPANGRPFAMVFGEQTRDGLPGIESLRAFLFKDGFGIAMKAKIWHEFPMALLDDTRLHIVLRQESHINLLKTPDYPDDARGPDLERFDMRMRAELFVAPR